jgi:hypothetical protein
LAVLQAARQAGGADGAGPADCFGCSDLVQRGAIGRDREKQLGILALAGPLDIQPNGPVSASDDIMSKLLEDQGGRGKRAVRPSGATAGRRDRNQLDSYTIGSSDPWSYPSATQAAPTKKPTTELIMRKILTVLAACVALYFPMAPASAQSGWGCTTTADTGSCSYPPYYISNNVWNPVPGASQTLSADSVNLWAARATIPTGGSNVVSYPAVFYDLPTPIAISDLQTADQNFSLEAVPTCTADSNWEVASDNWLNSTSSSDGVEIMVWENVCHVAPGSSNDDTGKTVTVGGQNFELWYNPDGDHGQQVIDFVSDSNITNGLINFAPMLRYLVNTGYVPASDTLVQLDMGEEIWSTGGNPETFTYNGYSTTVTSK